MCSWFFVKQKTAYEITRWLEFRPVLFRSHVVPIPPPLVQQRIAQAFADVGGERRPFVYGPEVAGAETHYGKRHHGEVHIAIGGAWCGERGESMGVSVWLKNKEDHA